MKSRFYFAARASATATLQLYAEGSSTPAQSPLRHLKKRSRKRDYAYIKHIGRLAREAFGRIKCDAAALVVRSPYLLSNCGVVVVAAPAALERPQAVCAGAQSRALLTLGNRMHAGE